jgi:hypothetical protein
MQFGNVFQRIRIIVINYIYIQCINMSDYRFDRTAFKIQSLKEADQASVFDKTVPYAGVYARSIFLFLRLTAFQCLINPG